MIATGIGLHFAFLGNKAPVFEKNSGVQLASILSFEKVREVPVVGALFSQKNVSKVSKTYQDLSSRMEKTAWAQWCKEEPLMSGLLMMVGGIGVCLLGFIFHIIRTDTRFS